MRETGISRSSAWRYDVLLHQEEDARVTVLERVRASRAAREIDAKHDDDDALREAQAQDISIQGQVPMPPWDGSRVKPAADEQLDAERFPVGLIERLERAQASQGQRELPSSHPANRGGGVVVAHGGIADPLPEEQPPGILGW